MPPYQLHSRSDWPPAGPRCPQCEMNLHVTERIGGRTNHSPLTPLGEAQAAALGAQLRAELAHHGVQPHRVRVFSSTAVRAVDTAQHVLAALQVRLRGMRGEDAWVARPWGHGVRRHSFAPAWNQSTLHSTPFRSLSLPTNPHLSLPCSWTPPAWCSRSGCWSWSRGSGRGRCAGSATRPSSPPALRPTPG